MTQLPCRVKLCLLLQLLLSAAILAASPAFADEKAPPLEPSGSGEAEKSRLERITVGDQALEAARKLEEQNHLAEADEMLQGVAFLYQLEIGDSPKLVGALGDLGRVLTKEHKKDEAKQAFARALRICNEHPDFTSAAISSFFETTGNCFKDLSEPLLAGDALSCAAALRKQGGQSNTSAERSPETKLEATTAEHAADSPSGGQASTAAISDRLITFARSTFVKGGPKVALDAFYAEVGSAYPQTRHIICDGKGRVREEMLYFMPDSQSEGKPADGSKSKPASQIERKVTFIDDFSKGIVVTIDQSGAVVSNMVREPIVYDKDSAATNHAKPLGSKDILGHHCTGYQYSDEGELNVVWIDQAIDFWVQREITDQSGKKTVIQLKQWSTVEPPDSAFKIPAGIKCSPMPAVVPNCAY